MRYAHSAWDHYFIGIMPKLCFLLLFLDAQNLKLLLSVKSRYWGAYLLERVSHVWTRGTSEALSQDLLARANPCWNARVVIVSSSCKLRAGVHKPWPSPRQLSQTFALDVHRIAWAFKVTCKFRFFTGEFTEAGHTHARVMVVPAELPWATAVRISD